VTVVPGEKALVAFNGTDYVKVGGAAGGSTTQVQYNNAGVFGGITNATTDGTTLSMTSPKIITAINDTNGNELIGVTATGSAVNEITVANAATGNNPVISATGSDTNVGITLTPKGTGAIKLSGISYPTADGTSGQTVKTDGSGTITFGTLGVPGGGTGLSTTTAYGLIAAGTTSTGNFQQVSGTGNSGQILTSNGAGALPSWQANSGISTGKSIAMAMIFGF
ncbi:MAG: hypothetical protein EBZ69_06635, partial [Alphaproteobacteria bacterium]|nr:hypothetical protein [Alphaproteobacteria bacterium]